MKHRKLENLSTSSHALLANEEPTKNDGKEKALARRECHEGEEQLDNHLLDRIESSTKTNLGK